MRKVKWQVQLRLAGGDGFEGGAKAEDEGGVSLEDKGGVKAEAVGEGEIRHLGEEDMF